MNGTPFIRLILALTLTGLITEVPGVKAQSSQPPSQQPLFGYPADPDTRIISYSSTPEMLANPELTPRIQVFGDGWVWVHYPEYMKKAGDYELYLNPGEIRQLLLVFSGVFDFDVNAVELSRKAIKEARELQDGRLLYRSDDTLEQFEVQLDSYQAGPGEPAQPVNLDLSWKNIVADARDYPQLDELQKLNGARNSIRSLLQRDDLAKVVMSDGSGQNQ